MEPPVVMMEPLSHIIHENGAIEIHEYLGEFIVNERLSRPNLKIAGITHEENVDDPPAIDINQLQEAAQSSQARGNSRTNTQHSIEEIVSRYEDPLVNEWASQNLI